MGMRRVAAAILAVVLAAGVAGCGNVGSADPDARADVELYVQHRLDSEWKSIDPGTDRPPASAAKFVLPNGWNHTVARCMADAGFPQYDYDPLTGVSQGMNDPRLVGVEGLAWYTCLRSLPQYDVRFPQLTGHQLDELYDYYVGWLVPCLGTVGYPVRAIPSRPDFNAGWKSGRPGAWNPYLTGVHLSSGTAAAVVFERCRPYPASL
ncbi:MAG: hypothetical protein ABI632_09280 [Pseudolysinimonas sp.]